MPVKSFHIITLGCKVNQYESQALREAWLAAGHHESPTPEGADLVLINSCAITAKAVADLRAAARKAKRQAPACQLLITGCAAESLPDELAPLPYDALVPQSAKSRLLQFLPQEDEGVEQEQQPAPSKDFWDYAGPAEKLTPGAPVFPPFSISGYARARAVLKVHDGCSQRCTYCIVPLSRGPSVSRPWPEVLAEAGRLAAAGFREIVLSGVNLRQYGTDLPQREDFWDLLSRLEAALTPEWAARPGGLRLRISSLEPGQLTDKALETLAGSRLVAPQLHLSLQSGSPAVLRRMGRGHYRLDDLPAFLAALGRIWPRFGLGADFIAAFPGESEDEFTETLTVARALPLTYAHVWPYSRRPGTPAAHLPGQLAPVVKKARAAALRQIFSAKKQAFLRAQLSLPQVWVAPEEGQTGVNEFYSDCRFVSAPPPGPGLISAKPLDVVKDKLLVRAF